MRMTRGEKIHTMHSRNFPAVIAMPARHGAVPPKAAVLEMPMRLERKAQATSKVVTLPSREEPATLEKVSRQESISFFRSGCDAFSFGVRMTLVALFALLGWPHPSRDNDPGPSAARPCHWDFINLVSRMCLPSGAPKFSPSRAAITPFCVGEAAIDKDAFARAA